MGQSDIYKFLKDNLGVSYSAKQLSDKLKIRTQTVWKNLKALERNDYITISKGDGVRLYSYKVVDEKFDNLFDEVTRLKQDEKYRHFPSEFIATLLLVKEVRRLKEVIQNGRN